MQWLFDAFHSHPELALFLTLALGHGMGSVRLGRFQLGPVLGCLLAGVLVGQIGIAVPEALKNTLFLLFLFAIGYKTGPLFFRGLKTMALPQIGLTLLLCGTALVTAWGVSAGLRLDAGTAGGLVAGAMTSSAALGTAGDALAKLGLDSDELAVLVGRRTVAFAVTYLIGMGLVVWLLSRVAPRILGVDLAAECRRLEVEMGTEAGMGDAQSAYLAVVSRAYAIVGPMIGRSVSEVEAQFEGGRVYVARLRRSGRIVDEIPPDLRLEAGDRVVLSARLESLTAPANPLSGHEVDDGELLSIPISTANAILTRRELAGRTLGELVSELNTRGVFLRRLTRDGTEMPFTQRTVVERGDALELIGSRPNLARVAEQLGHVEWPGAATDLTSVSVAILIGGILGLPALSLGRLELGLSLFVGTLLGGLVLGWARSNHPYFGFIPGPALWLFESFGLAGFLALIGIEAGPDFVAGVAQSGPTLILAGITVTTVPHIVTLLVGKYVVKLHPGILIGVCCGAGTSAPALAAVQEVAQSRIPALGYGVGCALGNIVLALWGGVIVLLLSD